MVAQESAAHGSGGTQAYLCHVSHFPSLPIFVSLLTVTTGFVPLHSHWLRGVFVALVNRDCRAWACTHARESREGRYSVACGSGLITSASLSYVKVSVKVGDHFIKIPYCGKEVFFLISPVLSLVAAANPMKLL